MLFTQSFVTNSRVARTQLENRDMLRNAANLQENGHAQILRGLGLEVNQGIIPADVYQEFDNTTVTRMRSDDGDTFLNDLMPLAKSINIGRLTYVTRRASDAGQVQTSMSGQVGIKMDQVEYNLDGFIIPVHDTGFFRNWRELSAQKAEGFDALIDDQRESVAAVRRRLRDSFLDGHKDKDGNLITLDARSWNGIKADSRVAQVVASFDFTDNAQSGDLNLTNLISVLDTLWITNNCSSDVTLYVSRQIARNWERKFTTNYSDGKIIDQLSGIQGVASIKVTNAMTGNEFFAIPLDGRVKPVTGMGMSTMALPRPMYNSNHEFVTATAVGWMVENDFFGKTCALYYG